MAVGWYEIDAESERQFLDWLAQQDADLRAQIKPWLRTLVNEPDGEPAELISVMHGEGREEMYSAEFRCPTASAEIVFLVNVSRNPPLITFLDYS